MGVALLFERVVQVHTNRGETERVVSPLSTGIIGGVRQPGLRYLQEAGWFQKQARHQRFGPNH
jgi:hypothetical protein